MILSVMTLVMTRTECHLKVELKSLKLFCVITDFKKRDVVFLLDSSDGTLQGFANIKDFVQSIVTDLNINPNMDRVAAVQYSSTTEIEFNLNRFSTLSEVLGGLKGLKHKGGHPPNIGAALQYVTSNVFTPGTGSRLLEGVPQILIILSGGRAGDDPRSAANSLRDTGVMAIAIGASDANFQELQSIAHMPNFALAVSDYEALPAAKENVFSLIREASKPVQQTTVTQVAGKNYLSPKIFRIILILHYN